MPPPPPPTHSTDSASSSDAEATAAVQAPRVSLRKRIVGASVWATGSVALAHVLRLGANLIVTRLLVPEAFGVMAIVLTVAIVLHNLSDMGLHQSLVRHPRGKERVFANTVWALQIVRGFVLAAAVIALGALLLLANQLGWVPASSAYAAPELPWVLMASSIGTIVYSFHSTNISTAQRDFDMRRSAALELTQQLSILVFMIVLAWWLRSIWAIVLSNLVGSFVGMWLSHRLWTGERNRWAWDPIVLRELVQFGRWLFVSSAIGVWALNADRLLLAGVADARYMGFYSIALGLATALTVVIERLYYSVMLPAFSETARENPQQLTSVYFRARQKMDPPVLLASGLLCAVGPLLIHILYDDRYREAGPILSILALALALSRYQLVHQIYLALDLPKYHAMLNTVRVASTFTLIPLGLWLGGITGGLFAIALRELPVVVLTLRLNARHGLNHWKMEAGVLVFWVLGFALGEAVNMAARAIGLQ